MSDTVHTSAPLRTAIALGEGTEVLEAMVGQRLPPGAEHHLWAVKQGCECWRCPLLASGRGPVPPTYPDNTDNFQPVDVTVVAEAPGHNEVEKGATLIGASGKAVRNALTQAGARMDRVGLTNAMLCQPDGDLKTYLRVVKKQGKPSPIECCRPRLMEELTWTKSAILMGNASLTAVGINESVMTVRGTPLTINLGGTAGTIPALATPHAAFVMRDEGRIFKPIFEADFRKAVRLTYQGSTWRDPVYFVPKNAAEVHNFLAVPRPRVAVDVETDGIDAWTCNLRRIGVGTDKESMIYSPLSVKGHLLHDRETIMQMARALAAYFTTQPRMDLHNGLAYDSVVLWRHGMPLADDHVFDTLVGHQIGNTSELPHGLDFLGSVYTDAPYWKGDFKHSNVKDDALLDRYLSFDIAVTFLAAPYVEYNLQTGNQQSVYALDHKLFTIGRSMSYLGLGVDHARRFAFAQEYQIKSDKLMAEFVAAAGRVVNPGSPPQMRQLLYRDLGLPQLDEHFTSTGDPSTDENTLLDLLALGVDKRAETIIHALLGWRAAEKVLSTNTGHVVDGKLEGGIQVHVDGRMRPTWRPGKRSGRWGSNDPNCQNLPKKLRSMFVPHPGNVFVAADMSAVELRMIALLAGDGPLIQAFAEFDAGRGPDVHVFNACTVFKTTPDKVDDTVRRFIKCAAAGSRVALPGRGLIKIEDLCEAKSVVTEEGPRDVAEWHDAGEMECVTVRTDRGLALTVAKRHRLQAYDGTWRWADELQSGDSLKLVLPDCASPDYVRMRINPWATRPRKKAGSVELPHDLPGMPEVTIDESMGYLLGTALGDGGVTTAGTYVVGLLADGVIDETKKCAIAHGLPTYYQRRKDSTDGKEFGRLNIYSATWRRFLARVGLHNGRGKVLRVPDVVFKSPKSVIVAFLAGMFDTDGTVGEMNVCSKSADFVSDIAMLLAMVGLHGKYEEAWNKTYKRFYYRLRLRRHNVRRLVAMGGMRACGKLARQMVHMANWGNRAQEPEQVAKVVRVEPAGVHRVYDLTVPSTMSYVANCLVNHNSFVYALSYDAQAQKIHQTLSLLRDDNLRPMFPGLTLAECERLYAQWWQLHPAIPVWKKKLIYGWRSLGFIETQWHKRKRYFIGGEKAEEMGNHPVQGSSADMQNDSIVLLTDAYPFDFANHRGLTVNGHDQLVVECAEREAEEVKKLVEKVMQKQIGPMLFPAKPTAGLDWKVVS